MAVLCTAVEIAAAKGFPSRIVQERGPGVRARRDKTHCFYFSFGNANFWPSGGIMRKTFRVIEISA